MIEKIIESKGKVAVLFDVALEKANEMKRGHLGSIGPGNKGIMKPIAIAPGSLVLSAKSSSGDQTDTCDDYIHCRLGIKSGSSMSTPNVAGASGLILQWFKSVKWIDSVDIDGPTLRALIINSCTLPGEATTPDLNFGHGFVDVSRALPLEGEFGVQMTPQKEKPRIKEDGRNTFKSLSLILIQCCMKAHQFHSQET